MAPDTDDSNDWASWAALEPELSDSEKQLRDRFVREYLVDQDPTRAASRCGFQAAFAKDYGQKFISEAYVQQQIRAVQEEPSLDPRQEEARLKLLVLRRLEREATDVNAPPASRIAALRELKGILGMDAPTKIEKRVVKHRGGVMRIPETVPLEVWEATAAKSQQALVEDART